MLLPENVAGYLVVGLTLLMIAVAILLLADTLRSSSSGDRRLKMLFRFYSKAQLSAARQHSRLKYDKRIRHNILLTELISIGLLCVGMICYWLMHCDMVLLVHHQGLPIGLSR